MPGRRVVCGWSVACAAQLCGMVVAVLVAGAPGQADADEGVDNGGDSGSCRKMPGKVPNLVPRGFVPKPETGDVVNHCSIEDGEPRP